MTDKKPTKHPPAEAGAPPNELADAWGAWLSLRWGFDLIGWDAVVAQLPPNIGARITLQRHRDGLLSALEARDDAATADKLELMVRTLSMASAKPLAMAGLAGKRGGEKGAAASREARRAEGSKRHAIIVEAGAYEGPESALVATVAKRAKAHPAYVRRVLKEIGT